MADVLALGLPLTTLSTGGLFAEVTPDKLAVLLLAMFIVRVNVHAGPMDDDDNVHVTTSDFSVHVGRLLTVVLPQLAPLDLMSRRCSEASALSD